MTAKTAIKQAGLLRSTSLVSFMTLLSRILGLARDAVIGYFFGAGAGADAFWVAFKIPNFLRRLFAEGSFSLAFVPVLAEYQEKHSEDALKDFISHMASILALVLSFLSVLAMLAAPWIIDVFAPGFGRESTRHALATHMLRITFPYILFISLTAFSGSILNAFGRYGVPAFTPVLLNVSIIGACFLLAPHLAHPLLALAWGVFIGGCAQLVCQVPFLRALGCLPRFKIHLHDPGVRKVLTLMLPTLIGSSVSQINLLFDTIFASFLPVGSVSWLYYSNRLVQFPLGVFGIAISTVILPHLSRQHVDAKGEKYAKTLEWAMRTVMLIAIPSAVGLALLAGPLLTTLFQYGHFHARDVMMARLSLIAFAFGVAAFMLVKVFAAGFYARQDTKTPVRIAIWCMVSNIVLSLLLMGPLKHAGLALATSFSAWLNTFLLWRGLRQLGIHGQSKAWGLYWLRVVLACSAMALFLWWCQGSLASWLAMGLLARVGHLLLCVGGAVLIYVGVLALCGVRLSQLRAQ